MNFLEYCSKSFRFTWWLSLFWYKGWKIIKHFLMFNDNLFVINQWYTLDIAINIPWENLSDLWEKCRFKPHSSKDETFNLASPLETKGFTPKAMFKFATNISRMVRIATARNTGMAVARACSLASVAEDPMVHARGFMLNDCSETERLWPVYAHF